MDVCTSFTLIPLLDTSKKVFSVHHVCNWPDDQKTSLLHALEWSWNYCFPAIIYVYIYALQVLTLFHEYMWNHISQCWFYCCVMISTAAVCRPPSCTFTVIIAYFSALFDYCLADVFEVVVVDDSIFLVHNGIAVQISIRHVVSRCLKSFFGDLDPLNQWCYLWKYDIELVHKQCDVSIQCVCLWELFHQWSYEHRFRLSDTMYLENTIISILMTALATPALYDLPFWSSWHWWYLLLLFELTLLCNWMLFLSEVNSQRSCYVRKIFAGAYF